jgi:hypothetical protein
MIAPNSTGDGFDATGWRMQQQQKHTDSATPGRIGPMPKKAYPRLPARVADAVSLQQRIADGVATPAEVQEYQRILNVLRSKLRAGSLSPENARRLGIE